jgi:hypothetical protein
VGNDDQQSVGNRIIKIKKKTIFVYSTIANVLFILYIYIDAIANNNANLGSRENYERLKLNYPQ